MPISEKRFSLQVLVLLLFLGCKNSIEPAVEKSNNDLWIENAKIIFSKAWVKGANAAQELCNSDSETYLKNMKALHIQDSLEFAQIVDKSFIKK